MLNMSESKQEPTRKRKQREEYGISTSQEADAIMRAASDGKSGRHWETLLGADARIHQAPGASHYVRLVLTDGERQMGVPVDALESATLRCDADDDFMLLYISRLLTPAQPLAPGTLPYATVQLDDVIKAIGWYPQNTRQRGDMRERVWQFIKFVSRAHIVGQRTYKQRDSLTGEELDTYMDSPPWMLGGRQREEVPQPSLFDDDKAPLSIEITATPMWTRLTALPDTAQFLPLGEVLGIIPGGKPAGAWARVIGLALSNFWRRHPRESMSGTLKPTRRELLERYTPATGSVIEFLSSPNASRAVQYWAGALRILVECDFVADTGEAAIPYEQQRDTLPLRGWQEDWLNGCVELQPGTAIIEVIKERAKALPIPTVSTRRKRKL